jgi:subtilase family serine protease
VPQLLFGRFARAWQHCTRAVSLAATAAVLAAAFSLPASPAEGSPAGPAGLRAACPHARAGYMQCFALYKPVRAGGAKPVGLTPRQIESAYRLPVAKGGTGPTVAVSIAYNAPHLAAYLAHYRSYFGLPPCTVASGCLRVVNQEGRSGPLPASGVPSGWALEETLDVSMISVACPRCHILVVEGRDPSDASMAATDVTAARLGAQVISNSYGQRENGAAVAYAAAYRKPGHVVVASAGDLGYTAAMFPADLTSVTAVGGTQLTRAPGTRRGWTEKVWDQPGLFGAGGSGCSAYVTKPAWQHDPHCPGRTVADVSAVAANVPIYNKNFGGWITVGGTSVAAPLIAGIYGLAGNASRIPLGYAYRHPRALFDITKGSNSLFVTPAQACGRDYLCVAKRGYDAPTGLGTPDGTGAF